MNEYNYGADEEMENILELFADKIVSSLDADLAADELASSVVQVFLQVAAAAGHRKPVKAVLKFLLDKIFLTVTVAGEDYLESPGLVRLLEVVVVVSTTYEKLSGRLFSRLFAGRLAAMAVHPTGNYLVQRLVDTLSQGDQLEAVWAEVGPSLEQILDAGCSGVVLCLVRASVRLERVQAVLLDQLAVSLHTADSLDQLAPLTLRLVNRDRLHNLPEFPISLHGSLILQEMLSFSKPIKLVRSILSVEGAELRRILSDPRGSHLADAFMQSKTIGEKSREGLVRRLAGELTGLACSKHGSRALDALWKYSSLKMKQVMVEELSRDELQLSSHPIGKFTSRSCALSAWRHQRDQWRTIVTQADKNAELFKDIIGDVSTLKRKAEDNPTIRKKPEELTVQKKIKEEAEDGPATSQLYPEQIEPAEKRKKKKAKSYFDDL